MLHTRTTQPANDYYVCIWCRIELSLDGPYRTPLEPQGKFRHVGVHVCAPSCPARPVGAVCYRKEA